MLALFLVLACLEGLKLKGKPAEARQLSQLLLSPLSVPTTII